MTGFRGKRWEHGMFRVILRTGVDFFFTGSIRFSTADDGFIDDYEVRCDDLLLTPPMREVVAVIRIGDDGTA